MHKPKLVVGIVVGLAVIALSTFPVYAHCGKCLGSAKDFLSAMQKGNVTLAQAIQVAESQGKGKAVAALPVEHEGKVHIHVFTLDGDKMMVNMVDAQTGKFVEARPAQEISMGEGGGHEGHEHGERPKGAPKGEQPKKP